MSKPSGLLVVEGTIKGFDKPSLVVIDSGASGNYVRRSTVEGSQQYAEALVARKSDTFTVRLATGTRVTVPKVPMDLNVKFLDFNSMERCLVLNLDARYNLILGMAWLERHEPWIDWRSKTLGAARNAPGGSLESHEPTSARNQKRFWRDYWTELINMLDVGISDFVDTVSVEDNSPGRGPMTGDSVVENPLDGTYDMCHENDVTSINTVSGVGVCKLRCQDMSPSDINDEELTLEGRVKSQMDVVFKDNEVYASNDEIMTLEGRVKSSMDVIFEYNKVQVHSDKVLTLEGRVKSKMMVVFDENEIPTPHDEALTQEGGVESGGDIVEVVAIRPEEELNSSSLLEKAFLEDTKKALNARSGPQILNTLQILPCFVEGIWRCVSREPPTRLPPDRGPNGKWRIVHAYNKLNAATIPAQTPIPRRDVLQNIMVGSTMYSALDLADGCYQLLMRASDIPLTAVSTPSVKQLFRPHRAYAQTYFNDIFVHSRAENGKNDVENHIEHLRAVLGCMRTHKLYANIDKCIFGAEEIPFMGCFIGKRGIRADPVKYSHNYAEVARPLSNILKKDVEWCWNAEHHEAFESIKEGLLHAPILALPDPDRPFSVVCDASDFAIGSALLQADSEGRERVIAFESRQMKAAEKNYPVHDKELLAMKYALVKFRVHLLDSKPFVIYTDHASLRTATQSPQISQRMARWLSFFAEYNFEVKYKPGKQNILDDALSHRPDYELAHLTVVSSSVTERIRVAYARDETCVAIMQALGSAAFENSKYRVGYQPREDLKYQILYEAHDTPLGGHLGREKTYRSSISMVFVLGLPRDAAGNTGIVVFVDRLSKMAYLSAVPDSIDGEETAKLFMDRVFGQHGLPLAIVSYYR
ncbi:unnamed protein product [Peronospora belbahrii]|uniref:RNA-directed DNA polymerase n=1 Tax=Peronospora belbahrii TaxID=622444 RepID=A0ABN8DBU7_9STRA|nr:unnamed protein product [Peronospora belbahrii]